MKLSRTGSLTDTSRERTVDQAVFYDSRFLSSSLAPAYYRIS